MQTRHTCFPTSSARCSLTHTGVRLKLRSASQSVPSPAHGTSRCQSRRGLCPACTACAGVKQRAASHALAAALSGIFLVTPSTAYANNVIRRPQYFEAPSAARPLGRVESKGPSVSEQVAAVDDLTRRARAAAEAGDYDEALRHYTEITTRFPGLAITERARVKRGLLLYETGNTQQAIAVLDDEEMALRGYAEVHAALAAILYKDRPFERQRAEDQWELANEFDHRYADLQWVKREKQWGPRMQSALQHFLALD